MELPTLPAPQAHDLSSHAALPSIAAYPAPGVALFEEQGERDAAPSGSEGLHALLRAASNQPDLRRDLPLLPAPLLILSSSDDAWVEKICTFTNAHVFCVTLKRKQF